MVACILGLLWHPSCVPPLGDPAYGGPFACRCSCDSTHDALLRFPCDADWFSGASSLSVGLWSRISCFGRLGTSPFEHHTVDRPIVAAVNFICSSCFSCGEGGLLVHPTERSTL